MVYHKCCFGLSLNSTHLEIAKPKKIEARMNARDKISMLFISISWGM